MSVASFVACPEDRASVFPTRSAAGGWRCSESWFYKWRDRPPTARQQRRAELDAAVKASFEDSGGTPGTYGSPRVWEDLVDDGLEGVDEDGGGVDGPPGPVRAGPRNASGGP